MATANVSTFLRRITRSMVAETLQDYSDGQLVKQFLQGRDDAVFETIVRRHGAMVYRVCWRVLQQAQDTEDAFQATFLILAQQLRTVRRHASLASWLHGVAHRVALKARSRSATRRRHEQHARAGKLPPDEAPWGEVRAILDDEVQRLPQKWRLPLILCYLEGRTQDEAARQLGSSERTLRRRLEEAREALGRRLVGRGYAWSAALYPVLLSDCQTPTALTPRLVISTVEAAASIATGQAALSAIASAPVAALTEGVLETMFTSKLKIATSLLLGAAIVVGAGGIVYQSHAATPHDSPRSLAIKAPREVRATPNDDKPEAAPKPVMVKGDAYFGQVAWCADDKTVVTVGQTGEVVEVKDSDGKNPMKVTVPHTTIKVWDAKTGKEVRSLGEEKGSLLSWLAFSRDKQVAAVVAQKVFDLAKGEGPNPAETEVRLMDTRTWEVKSRLKAAEIGLAQPIIALSPDGTKIAVAGHVEGGVIVAKPGEEVLAQKLKLWDIEKGKPIEWKPKKPKGGEQLFKRLHCVSFSPNGKLIAVGEEDRALIFDAQTGEPRAVLDDKIDPLAGIVFSPDGQLVVTGTQEKAVKVWAVSDGKLLRTMKGNKGHILTGAFSPDGALLATGGNFEKEKDKWQSEVILWDAKTGEMKRILPTDMPVAVLSVAFSADGKFLAVAGGLVGDAKDGGKTSGEMHILPLN